MGEKSSDPPSTLRTLLILTVIAMTLFFLLGPVIPRIILVAVFPLLIMFFYFRVFYRYLSGRRGYQNRYQRTGQEHQTQEQIIRILILALVTVIFYVLVNGGLQLVGIDAPNIAFGITLVVMVVTVKFVDDYVSKDMEEYVEYKEKKHTEFVNSLGEAEGMCMSCRRKMSKDEKFCPHCGFEQRRSDTDTSYTGS